MSKMYSTKIETNPSGICKMNCEIRSLLSSVVVISVAINAMIKTKSRGEK